VRIEGANGERVGIRDGAERSCPIEKHTECQPRCDGDFLALSVAGGIGMLYYALMFLVVALIAGVLGVTGVAGIASQIAWVLFLIGILLLGINFLTGNRPRSVV
jgi:uncharacterized membrane protein YtjA (UPF0391 family)